MELFDVDVNSVHLVGEPANRRKFAVIKNLLGITEDLDPDDDGGGVTVKKADLLDKLDGLDGETVTPEAFIEMFGADAIQKALKPAEKDPPKDDPAKDPPAGLDKLDKETRAYVAALEQTRKQLMETVTFLKGEHEKQRVTDLTLRRERLKKAGWEIDDKAEEPEVAAMERAVKGISNRLVEAGIFKTHGDDPATIADEPTGNRPILAEVQKEVVNWLGREPHDEAEAAKTRAAIYRKYPGLLDSVIREEKQAAGR